MTYYCLPCCSQTTSSRVSQSWSWCDANIHILFFGWQNNFIGQTRRREARNKCKAITIVLTMHRPTQCTHKYKLPPHTMHGHQNKRKVSGEMCTEGAVVCEIYLSSQCVCTHIEQWLKWVGERVGVVVIVPVRLIFLSVASNMHTKVI